MGAKGSKQTVQRTDTRKNIIQRQIEGLSKFTTNISTALVKREDVEIIDKIATNAKIQLERDTKPMTKADLIAILVRLRTKENCTPEDVKRMIGECNKYTVGELNGIIRCAVFDFSHLTNNSDVGKIKDIEEIMLTIEN